MNRIRPRSLGLALCIFLALWHTCWALLVWLGAAQWLIDFIFRLHMIAPPYKIAAFSLGTSVSLIAVTAGLGFSLGWFLAVIWNRYGVDTVGK